MTADQMLDYVFNQLDEPSREDFERELASDPAGSDRVARLDGAVRRLIDDGDDYAPPVGLASATLALVERRKSRPQVQDFIPTRVPFRMADFAVAATVFFAAIFTLAVPILRSRAQMDQAACAFNLGRVGVSLAKYSTTHGTYPHVPASLPAGAYGVMLQDSHTLSDPGVLLCPTASRSKSPSALPDFERFQKLAASSPDACCRLFDGHFAYNVGYRSPNGQVAPVSDSLRSSVPVASDGPPWSDEEGVLDGNSPNHGGRGQNVLFTDGHVSFRRNRWIGPNDTDLFLNEAKLPAHGLTPEDSAVLPSGAPVRVR